MELKNGAWLLWNWFVGQGLCLLSLDEIWSHLETLLQLIHELDENELSRGICLDGGYACFTTSSFELGGESLNKLIVCVSLFLDIVSFCFEHLVKVCLWWLVVFVLLGPSSILLLLPSIHLFSSFRFLFFWCLFLLLLEAIFNFLSLGFTILVSLGLSILLSFLLKTFTFFIGGFLVYHSFKCIVLFAV